MTIIIDILATYIGKTLTVVQIDPDDDTYAPGYKTYILTFDDGSTLTFAGWGSVRHKVKEPLASLPAAMNL